MIIMLDKQCAFLRAQCLYGTLPKQTTRSSTLFQRLLHVCFTHGTYATAGKVKRKTSEALDVINRKRPFIMQIKEDVI